MLKYQNVAWLIIIVLNIATIDLLSAQTVENESSVVSICTMPAGTTLLIETVDMVSSQTAKEGQRFAIRLAEPVVLDRVTVIPVGTMGVGEVVHAAARQGFSGRAGELILAARYLESGNEKWPLRSFRISKAGEQIAGLAMYGTAVAHTLESRDIEIPVGTRAEAKLVSEISVKCTIANRNESIVPN